ncbi:LGFP repeat-containing protein [Propionibacterium cyclohexanicum]|uniref:LGFP repeat-containing protein n=1 Tax=Propionibacterium cyclohexanicum TaxID=64702 RepID=A0A1H9TD13_9ACTN|nr:hypothetical protein [Propionibacterium cyclohexanicum]SER95008.1 LGFP repeat-containing protein [Propionibacterium cyclohexanicum]
MRDHAQRGQVRSAHLLGEVLMLCATVCCASFAPNSASPASATTNLSSAVNASIDSAARQGITQYVSIVDRSTGKVVFATPNASTQVASESIVKLYIAVWWLHQTGGDASAVSCGDIGYMIRESDDDIATACWRPDILSDVSSWYGLSASNNDPVTWTYWGAAHISASDVARLLNSAANDPLVGSWLINQMAQTTSLGADGYDQDFGFRAVSGAASKQGWDNDGYWLPQTGMIHSAGYVGNFAAVILQMGDLSSQEDAMHATATNTAQAIAANAHPTQGAIGAAYQQFGGLTSELGYPTSDQAASTGGGTTQSFQHGAMYWTAATGAHALLDPIRSYWMKAGGPSAALGYPNSPQTCDLPAGGCWQSFVGGILVVTGQNVVEIAGPLASQWTGQREVLGAPVGAAVSGAVEDGHRTISQDFAGGVLHASVLAPAPAPAHLGFWASVRKGIGKVLDGIRARL